MDSTTAVAYVNRMGGIQSPVLAQLAIQLWQWCLDRRITLSAIFQERRTHVLTAKVPAMNSKKLCVAFFPWETRGPLLQWSLPRLPARVVRHSIPPSSLGSSVSLTCRSISLPPLATKADPAWLLDLRSLLSHVRGSS